jgi:hypothetical protein
MSDRLKRFAAFLAEWAAEPQTSDAQPTRREPPVEDLDSLDEGSGRGATNADPGGNLPEASVTRPHQVLRRLPATDSRPLASNALNPQEGKEGLRRPLSDQNSCQRANEREEPLPMAAIAPLPQSTRPDELAEVKVELLAERAAIQNEPALPPPGTPERERLDAAKRRMLAGLHDAALQRPSSWPDANAIPSVGCWCSRCRGQRWWRERVAPKGWQCATCHPPPEAAVTAELQT